MGHSHYHYCFLRFSVSSQAPAFEMSELYRINYSNLETNNVNMKLPYCCKVLCVLIIESLHFAEYLVIPHHCDKPFVDG